MTVAVVYIARGVGAGLPAVEAFFDAYRRFPPGCPHRLVVIAKGWESVPGLPSLIDQVRAVGADLVTLPDDGFDWGAYMRVAPALNEQFLCLVNTHSRPMVPGWLALLRQSALLPGVGAVGATGSWGSMSVTWPLFEPGIFRLALYPARLALVFMRLCRNFGSFPSFPNPHLRSNVLLVNRAIFISFCRCHEIPHSKRDAHILESGRRGFTAYLKSLGMRALVVGANGVAYAPDAWISSGTFRLPDNVNLLVSDNQTRYYQQADSKLKRRLENAAWGEVLTSSEKTIPSSVNFGEKTLDIEPKKQGKKSEFLSKTLCPYCHAKAKPFLLARDINRHITEEVFSYSQCTKCGLVFMDEIPEDIARYYSGGYQPIPASLGELRALAHDEKYRLEPILRYKCSGKLLELGPWIGMFSSNAKDAGFDVTVVDMSADCVNFLENVLKVRAFQSDEPAVTIANLDERFDVVVMWHCIEHFPRPWEVIQQIARVLQPGGVLLVALPNVESYECSVLKSRWTHIDAPRHLHFYPLTSLTSLCQENGLRCLEATTSDHLSRVLRRSSWRAVGKSLAPWSSFFGRILSALVGRLDSIFVGRAGRREGAGAGITAVYVKEASPVQTEVMY